MDNESISQAKTDKKQTILVTIVISIILVTILSVIILASLSTARDGRGSNRARALATVSYVGSEIIICLDDKKIPTVPKDSMAGGGVICSEGVLKNWATTSAHWIEWPTLANTFGYQYSIASTSQSGMSGNASVLPNTFYLINSSTKDYITCTWSDKQNLSCR